MAILHITNGDGAAGVISESGIGGDILPWRDSMHLGPFPLHLGLDALSVVRADYLAGADLDKAEVRAGFRQRDDHLRSAGTYERVILWFEYDLLDQLQILQVLDWFADNDIGPAPLAMVCIDRFDGADGFRGLGQLQPEQLASLYPESAAVTAAQLALAKAGWAAFRSPDPTDMESLLTGDTSALPFLHAALSRYLQDYPAFRDGLTRTEWQIMTLVESGLSSPEHVFQQNIALETALHIGDWDIWRCIAGLCASEIPLLLVDGGAFKYQPQMSISREDFVSQRLSLTPAGAQVLAGQWDGFACISRDFWHGGVHVQSGTPMWTWRHDIDGLCLRLPS